MKTTTHSESDCSVFLLERPVTVCRHLRPNCTCISFLYLYFVPFETKLSLHTSLSISAPVAKLSLYIGLNVPAPTGRSDELAGTLRLTLGILCRDAVQGRVGTTINWALISAGRINSAVPFPIDVGPLRRRSARHHTAALLTAVMRSDYANKWVNKFIYRSAMGLAPSIL